jgi:hypothetical protein
MADGALVVSAGIVSGELILGLSDGSVLRVGQVVGPQGLRGEQGGKGDTGKPGQDGKTILHSQGLPKPDQGKEGDFVIDLTEWVIYGPKAGDNASWGKGQPLLAERSNPKGGASHSDRWKAGGGRFFPLGGTSASVTQPPAPAQGGLEPILSNGQPLGANIWNPVAIDADGDLMEVTMFFSRSGGNEVYTAKVIAYRANTIGNLTIAWESAQPQQLPYTVEFNAVVTGQSLQLNVRSSVGWEAVRGRVSKL